jgi:hypothetical protein
MNNHPNHRSKEALHKEALVASPSTRSLDRAPTLSNDPNQFKGDDAIFVLVDAGGPVLELDLITDRARHVAPAGADVIGYSGNDQVLNRSTWQPLRLGCTDGQPLRFGERLTAIRLVADRKRAKVTEEYSEKKKRPASGSGFVYAYYPILDGGGLPAEQSLGHMLDDLHISINHGPFQPASSATIGAFAQRIDALWHKQPAVSVRVKYTKTTDFILKLRFTVSGFGAAAPAFAAGGSDGGGGGDVVLYAAGMVVLSNLSLYGGATCPAKQAGGGGGKENKRKKRKLPPWSDAVPSPPAAAAGGGAAPACGGGTGGGCAALAPAGRQLQFDLEPVLATPGRSPTPAQPSLSPPLAPHTFVWSPGDDDDFSQAVHGSWTQETDDILHFDTPGVDTGASSVFAAMALAPASPVAVPADPAPAPAPAHLSVDVLLGNLPQLLLLLPQLPQWAQSAVRHQVTTADFAWFNTASLSNLSNHGNNDTQCSFVM